LDKHLPEKKDKIAIIWEGDEPTDIKRITYGELFLQVCKFSNGLKSLGIKKGDSVAIYLPNCPEAAVAMLSCARIGAVHRLIIELFIYFCKSVSVLSLQDLAVIHCEIVSAMLNQSWSSLLMSLHEDKNLFF
jgi:acyl-coenzyme A synthetase/AMP-(fatty) acid ligase